MDSTSPELVLGPVLLSKPRKPVSSKDWEEQRENFTRLYAIENHSLRVTMVEMRRLYSFEATERQYKRRIAQWHLDKKIKDDEMRIMLRKRKQRKRKGKKSIFTIRGRRVNPKKMEQLSPRNVSQKDSQSDGESICTVTLPPISSLIGFSPRAKTLFEASCGVDKEIQAGSPLTTMKTFQSLDTVFHGLDVNFIDRDIQLGDIPGEETELDHYGSKIAYEIPKSLMPLPDALSKNAINFLYFHHFINHTSKLLVTHDCLNSPFKTILPQSKRPRSRTFLSSRIERRYYVSLEI
ncbi:hypothetical protein OEA41_000707 [Lepraria neglecta]|uniref:Clr5 domain-containing protein n=1 Tax=Lepraria neglecta TaxID=209136 RepID=A0AAE0DQ15_9LECA|nr:hypothetical protein OEA41_000707 [Lepraria neglecta]